MNFVEPSVTAIIEDDPMKVIERAYRICYKSEDKIKEGSASLIYKLLHEGEKGKMIHSSPLEHRRIIIAVDEWVIDAVDSWQIERGTSFLEIWPQKTPSADEHQFTISGNFRAFFDFVKGYETDEDDFKGDYHRLDEARLIINTELHKYFPYVFKYMEPYDDTDNAIDWEACTYVGEDTDYVSFHVITTRDILQEIARNRTISPNVESTRYCNYGKRGMTFCIPRPYEWTNDIDWEELNSGIISGTGMTKATPFAMQFYTTCRDAEERYNKAIANGIKPQEARMLLPGALKTEMILTGRFCDWAHFLKLRNDSAAHPQMVYIANKIEEWFNQNGHADIRMYDRY